MIARRGRKGRSERGGRTGRADLQRVVIEPLLQELDQREVEVVKLLAVIRIRLLQPFQVVLAQPLDFDRAADLTLAAVDADCGELARPRAIDHFGRREPIERVVGGHISGNLVTGQCS